MDFKKVLDFFEKNKKKYLKEELKNKGVGSLNNIETKNKIIDALKNTIGAQNDVLDQYENGIRLAIAQLEESESIPFALDALYEALGEKKILK